MSTIIEVKGVAKAFGSQTVLNDVNFTVKKGEIIGLLGPNGKRREHPYTDFEWRTEA